MADKKTDEQPFTKVNYFEVILIFGAIILISGMVGEFISGIWVAAFGGWTKASEAILKETLDAQIVLNEELSTNFGEPGILEVYKNKSVIAYLSNHAYLSVPYPDRKETIKIVGALWCENEKIKNAPLFFSKVTLSDIRTGEQLASYGCFTGSTNWK